MRNQTFMPNLWPSSIVISLSKCGDLLVPITIYTVTVTINYEALAYIESDEKVDASKLTKTITLRVFMLPRHFRLLDVTD